MTLRAGLTFGTKNPAWRQKIEPYCDALRGAGLEPVLLLPGDANTLVAGVVIGGGTDIDPALYGAARHAETEDPDIARDQHEATWLRRMLDRDQPVLAICRGLQMFNILHGGTLHQHIENHRAPGIDDAHQVAVVPGSRLHAIAGQAAYTVNSRHHQAVARVPAPLVISARATDGTIEALEHPDKRLALAVQWHPEDRVRTHPPDAALFRAFAEACAEACARPA